MAMQEEGKREKEELARVRKERVDRDMAESDLLNRMEQLRDETDRERQEKAKLVEEKRRIEQEMIEAEKDRQELMRIQREKEKSDVEMAARMSEVCTCVCALHCSRDREMLEAEKSGRHSCGQRRRKKVCDLAMPDRMSQVRAFGVPCCVCHNHKMLESEGRWQEVLQVLRVKEKLNRKNLVR